MFPCKSALTSFHILKQNKIQIAICLTMGKFQINVISLSFKDSFYRFELFAQNLVTLKFFSRLLKRCPKSFIIANNSKSV